MSYDVHTAAVFGLFARREVFLALDLEEDFYALEGRCDQGHGDCGEEPGSGDLGYGELVVFYRGESADEVLAYVVAPEGHRDCDSPLSASVFPGLREKREGDKHIGVTPTNGALTPA